MADIRGERAVVRIEAYLDDAKQPYQVVVPPNTIELDTKQLEDGPHLLRLVAYDASGNVGRRQIPFMVQNGPGITVTGLRANERVNGRITMDLNAFGGDEPFDPVRAESSGPIPVWTWVLIAAIAAWGLWYGLESFETPPLYAKTPTYEREPTLSAQQPLSAAKPPAYTGKSSAGGFDYASTGPQLYTQNCAACHGAAGAGVPGAFPALAGNPVVTAASPHEHIEIVLHGLKGKAIKGTSYTSQMPSFSQLTDQDIAAIIDHERTSWGNNAPIVTPDEVKGAR